VKPVQGGGYRSHQRGGDEVHSGGYRSHQRGGDEVHSGGYRSHQRGGSAPRYERFGGRSGGSDNGGSWRKPL